MIISPIGSNLIWTDSDRYLTMQSLTGNLGVIMLWKDYNYHRLFGVCLDPDGMTIGTAPAIFGVDSQNYLTLGGYPVAAASSFGDILIVWATSFNHGSITSVGFDIFAQRYSIECSPLTSIFRVNQYTTGDQLAPQVSALPNGNFFISWTDASTRSGLGSEIYAAEITPAGGIVVPEFQVNMNSPGNQSTPSVCLLGNNNTVVAWTSDSSSDSSGTGVFFRILTPGEVPPVFIHNLLSLSQGDQVILGSGFLLAHDTNVGHNDTNLQYTFSNIQHAQIELATDPGIAATLVTHQQIMDGQVILIHDGSSSAPSYRVSVTDQISFSPAVQAAVTFNLKPLWITNQLIVNQGETITLTTGMLQAIDDQPDAQLIFVIQFNTNGYFALATASGSPIITFTQQQVNNLQVLFVTDGSSNPPSYNLTLSDGLVTLPAQSPVLHFNEKPVLINNQWGFFQGETTLVSSVMISAIDYLQPSTNIIIALSNISHGHFESISNPQVAITQFLQQQVTTGDIQFITDGSFLSPNFLISLSNSLRTIPPVPGIIQFNSKPIIQSNQWLVHQGERLIITSSILSAIDDASVGNLIYTVYNITASHFEWTLNQGTSVLQLTQQQIDSGEIILIHDDSLLPPSFRFSLSDGHFNLPIVSASINFKRRPILNLNPISMNQGQNITLTPQILNITADSPAIQITILLSNLRYMQSSSLLFTQQQLFNNEVSLIPDDSLNVPAGEVSVSDGYFSLSAVPFIIQFNQRPRIIRNQFPLQQGRVLPLTAFNLDGDDDNPPDQLTLSVSNLAHMQFEKQSLTGVSINQFTLAELRNGTIQIVPDGSTQLPTGQIKISDGVLTTAPLDLSMTLNLQPVLVANQLSITQGQSMLMTSRELNVQDDNSLPSQLTYIISENTACQFERTGSPGLAISAFTQAELLSQVIQLVHNGNPQPPGYFIKVTDSILSSPEQSAIVSFNYLPSLALNQFTISEGEEKPISTAMLQASDPDNTPEQLQIRFTNMLHIRFFLANTSQASLSQCSYQDIIDGRIWMQHDDSESAPSWQIILSDPLIMRDPLVASINYFPVNDKPVMAGATDPLVYDQLGASLVIDPQLTVADVDSATLESATVAISDNRNIGEDTLGVRNGQGIIGRYDSSTAILTLSGAASPTIYQSILRTVYYKNTASVPSVQPRTISMTVFDGDLNSQEYVREIDISKDPIKSCYLKGIVAINQLHDGSPACNAINTTVYFFISMGGLLFTLLIKKMADTVRDKQWREHRGLVIHDELRRALKLELPSPHAANEYIHFVCRLLSEMLRIKRVASQDKASHYDTVMEEVKKMSEENQKEVTRGLVSAFNETIMFPTHPYPYCYNTRRYSPSGILLEMPVYRYAGFLPSYILDLLFCRGFKLTSYNFSLVVAEAAFSQILEKVSQVARKHPQSLEGKLFSGGDGDIELQTLVDEKGGQKYRKSSPRIFKEASQQRDVLSSPTVSEENIFTVT